MSAFGKPLVWEELFVLKYFEFGAEVENVNILETIGCM